MGEHGFTASKTMACLYSNRKTEVKAVAHVDDFLVTGPKAELEKLRGFERRFRGGATSWGQAKARPLRGPFWAEL